MPLNDFGQANIPFFKKNKKTTLFTGIWQRNYSRIAKD